MASEVVSGFALHKLPYIVIRKLLPCRAKLGLRKQDRKVNQMLQERVLSTPSLRKALYKALTSDAVGMNAVQQPVGLQTELGNRSKLGRRRLRLFDDHAQHLSRCVSSE